MRYELTDHEWAAIKPMLQILLAPRGNPSSPFGEFMPLEQRFADDYRCGPQSARLDREMELRTKASGVIEATIEAESYQISSTPAKSINTAMPARIAPWAAAFTRQAVPAASHANV